MRAQGQRCPTIPILKMARITIATIKPGTVIEVGYRGKSMGPSEFLGFGTDDETASFASLAQLRCNVADEDAHRAIFRDVKDGSTWAAYRLNKRWVVGTSADYLQFFA
jgi:hypothetical protein